MPPLFLIALLGVSFLGAYGANEANTRNSADAVAPKTGVSAAPTKPYDARLATIVSPDTKSSKSTGANVMSRTESEDKPINSEPGVINIEKIENWMK